MNRLIIKTLLSSAPSEPALARIDATCLICCSSTLGFAVCICLPIPLLVFLTSCSTSYKSILSTSMLWEKHKESRAIGKHQRIWLHSTTYSYAVSYLVWALIRISSPMHRAQPDLGADDPFAKQGWCSQPVPQNRGRAVDFYKQQAWLARHLCPLGALNLFGSMRSSWMDLPSFWGVLLFLVSKNGGLRFRRKQSKKNLVTSTRFIVIL